MRIVVRLFAQQRQALGWRQRPIDVPEGATVADAWDVLVAAHPELRGATAFVRFARNAVYARPDEPLADGDELAVIPPVAGGAPFGGADALEAPPMPRLELREAALDEALLGELRRVVPTHADGALVLFVGQTRESPGTAAPGQEVEAERYAGERVVALEYEAFEEMALGVLRAIAAEIAERLGVQRLAIVHRVGEVPVGDASVVIAAAAPHRAAAFEACRYAIEELKARAPIWKSERFAGGRVWVGAPARTGPQEDAAASVERVGPHAAEEATSG